MFDMGIIDIHTVQRVTKGEPMLGILVFNRTEPHDMVKCFYVHAVQKDGAWRIFQVTVQSWW